MTSMQRGGPPRWIFTTVMVGAFIACGIYLGVMRIEGAGAGDIVRAACFALVGALMLWKVLSRPQSN